MFVSLVVQVFLNTVKLLFLLIHVHLKHAQVPRYVLHHVVLIIKSLVVVQGIRQCVIIVQVIIHFFQNSRHRLFGHRELYRDHIKHVLLVIQRLIEERHIIVHQVLDQMFFIKDIHVVLCFHFVGVMNVLVVRLRYLYLLVI